jgi:branched-chain amino acid transport system substrate-binding protein
MQTSREEKEMSLKNWLYALSAAASLTLPAVHDAQAEDSIYVPLFTYRTGPFAGSGTPSPTACTTT